MAVRTSPWNSIWREEPFMTEQVTIAVVDDHPLYRAGVVRTLAEAPDIRVVGEGGSAADALELARRTRPKLLLIDISMPGGGIEAVRMLAQAFPGSWAIMLTSSEQEDDIIEALAAGARGYVLKGVGARELLSIVRTVAAGGSYVSPTLAGRLLVAMRHKSAAPVAKDSAGTLTTREEEILELVAQGKSNKEVGRSLQLQEKTIKHYMTNILQKLQVRNRTEAAIVARRRAGLENNL
jgi:DNA-binding NarL/FixJ family response regulator